MVDTNNTSPGGSPLPPNMGEDRAQHAQTTGQQPSYQQAYQHSYAQPQHTPVTVEKKSHNGRTFGVAFAGAALACVIGLGGFGIWQTATGGSSSGDGGQSTQLGSTTSSVIDAGSENQTLAEAVAEKALPSVAAIDVYTNQSSMGGMYGYGYGYGYGGGSDTLTQSSLGSGVVLTDDGYIVTNYHVIEGADALKVTIEGEQYDAEVVGSDPSSDLAVIKAKDASGLTAIELGDSDNLTIGEWVMTIGSPFGLEQSVATGIVSATSRSQIMDSNSQQGGSGETTIYPNMIQTDAAINPGNSGGALVDADGKLIGINTLITSYSGNYSGVGFAIPVNYAVNIAQQIIDGKVPTHAQLGVSLSNVNAQTAERYGLPVDEGAYIAAVNSGSGAAEAGLQVGDIVTKFDGQAVESASDLMLDVRSKNPGDKVTLEVNRNGETKEVEVTLGSDESSQGASTQQNSSSSQDLLERLLGGGSGSQQDAA
ncbi:S1C family serine protease [Rubneribacter sp.]